MSYAIFRVEPINKLSDPVQIGSHTNKRKKPSTTFTRERAKRAMAFNYFSTLTLKLSLFPSVSSLIILYASYALFNDSTVRTLGIEFPSVFV